MTKAFMRPLLLALLLGSALTQAGPARSGSFQPDPPLLAEATRELGLLHSSVYRHRTSVNEAAGRFDYDCLGFIDYALRRIAPKAYAELGSSGPPRRAHWPRTITRCSPDRTRPLSPGRAYRPCRRCAPVTDSTATPHAQDSRGPGERVQSGLGSGMIGVLVDMRGYPLAYRWKGGESVRAEAPPIAFGRLRAAN